jgi:arylsulfatase
MANRSWTIAARIEAKPGARGVIGAVGGHSAGWSLWLDAQSHPVFTYRLFDLQTLTLKGANPLAPGSREVSVDFAYDGGGYAKGGEVSLSVDGKPVTSGRLNASTTKLFTIDETFDVGLDRGTPVAEYPSSLKYGYPFSNGAVGKVTICLSARE